MKYSVTEKITHIFIYNDLISYEDKDLYSYGLQQGFLMILGIVTSLGIGFYLGMLSQSIIFLLAYIPLRSYAGGYHEKTQLRCYVFSIAMILTVLLVIKQIIWTGFICFMVAVIAGGIIFLLAPVEDNNKPLSQTEQAVYKKQTHIILNVLLSLALLLWIIGKQQSAVSIIVALAMLASMIVLGKLKVTFNSLIK